MTYEEYFVWESTQEVRHEYCHGEVIAMAGGTRNHNRVSLNFFKSLDNALADRLFVKSINAEIAVNDLYQQVQFDNAAKN